MPASPMEMVFDQPVCFLAVLPSVGLSFSSLQPVVVKRGEVGRLEACESGLPAR